MEADGSQPGAEAALGLSCTAVVAETLEEEVELCFYVSLPAVLHLLFRPSSPRPAATCQSVKDIIRRHAAGRLRPACFIDLPDGRLTAAERRARKQIDSLRAPGGA